MGQLYVCGCTGARDLHINGIMWFVDLPASETERKEA